MEDIPTLDDLLATPGASSLERVKKKLVENGFTWEGNYYSLQVRAAVVDLAVEVLGLPRLRQTMLGCIQDNHNNVFGYYIVKFDGKFTFPNTPKQAVYRGEMISLQPTFLSATPVGENYRETLSLMERLEQKCREHEYGVLRMRTPSG